MADLEGVKVAKNYHVGIPFASNDGLYVKGANNLDQGMEKHLSNILNPGSGNTIMFAFDHGYFMGSTIGLECLDLVIPKLTPYVDILMGTRDALHSCVTPVYDKGIALRSTSGSFMLNDDLPHEILVVDIEDVIRMNADCIATQIFTGADGQLSSIKNPSKAINLGTRYSIPTMGTVAVGKQMERTDRFFKPATRIVAEMGANIIKTYCCENSEEVVTTCPVPIVMAGDKKLPEKEALTLAYNAISDGAHGVGMGRSIFQSVHSLEVAVTIGKIVYGGFMDKEAYEFFGDVTH